MRRFKAALCAAMLLPMTQAWTQAPQPGSRLPQPAISTIAPSFSIGAYAGFPMVLSSPQSLYNYSDYSPRAGLAVWHSGNAAVSRVTYRPFVAGFFHYRRSPLCEYIQQFGLLRLTAVFNKCVVFLIIIRVWSGAGDQHRWARLTVFRLDGRRQRNCARLPDDDDKGFARQSIERIIRSYRFSLATAVRCNAAYRRHHPVEQRVVARCFTPLSSREFGEHVRPNTKE